MRVSDVPAVPQPLRSAELSGYYVDVESFGNVFANSTRSQAQCDNLCRDLGAQCAGYTWERKSAICLPMEPSVLLFPDMLRTCEAAADCALSLTSALLSSGGGNSAAPQPPAATKQPLRSQHPPLYLLRMEEEEWVAAWCHQHQHQHQTRRGVAQTHSQYHPSSHHPQAHCPVALSRV
jgi:hypothetical protein